MERKEAAGRFAARKDNLQRQPNPAAYHPSRGRRKKTATNSQLDRGHVQGSDTKKGQTSKVRRFEETNPLTSLRRCNILMTTDAIRFTHAALAFKIRPCKMTIWRHFSLSLSPIFPFLFLLFLCSSSLHIIFFHIFFHFLLEHFVSITLSSSFLTLVFQSVDFGEKYFLFNN